MEKGRFHLNSKAECKDLARFIENHKVVYIRHLMASNMKAYGDLISKHIAAIHYSEALKDDVDITIKENHLNEDNYKPRSWGKSSY